MGLPFDQPVACYPETRFAQPPLPPVPLPYGVVVKESGALFLSGEAHKLIPSGVVAGDKALLAMQDRRVGRASESRGKVTSSRLRRAMTTVDSAGWAFWSKVG